MTSTLAGRTRPPARRSAHCVLPPSDTRSQRSGPRSSRFRASRRTECGRPVGSGRSRAPAQEPDHRQLARLLRARRERPRGRRAAEQRDERAPFHSITSSAVASSVGGTVRPSILAVLRVDDQLELGRLHDRQVRGLGALEDAAAIDADLTTRIRQARSVAHQPAGFGILSRAKCRGNRERVAKWANWTRRLVKKGSVPTKNASGRSRPNVANAASISRLGRR